MKKLIYLLAFLPVVGFAQEQEEKVEEKSAYNKWSIEADAGFLKPSMDNADNGYVFDFDNRLDLFSGNVAGRYMFNPKFGLKLGLGVNVMQQLDGAPAEDWRSVFVRLTPEAVLNLSNVLDFKSVNALKRVGLLLHSGVGVSALTFDGEENGAVPGDKLFASNDVVATGILGVTPQFKISERFTAQADVSFYYNAGQNWSWDGFERINGNDFLDSNLMTVSLGLAYNLGKAESHADWVDFAKMDQEEEIDEIAALTARLDAIDNKINDSDNDGIADYYDLEPNTAAGVAVNTKGQTLDSDKDGIPDNLKKALDRKYSVSSTPEYTKEEVMLATTKNLLESGIANVYFSSDSDKPLNSSLFAVDAIISYLKSTPGAVAELQGFADKRGSTAYNKNLSEKRAKKVKDLIASAGIDPSRLIVVANGELNSDNTSTSLQLRRKVVFKLK